MPHRKLLAFAVFSTFQTGLAWLLLPFVYLFHGSGKGRRKTGRRILIASLGGIGDNVFVVPALRALRGKYPQAEITLVVRPYLAGFHDLAPDCIDRELLYHSGKTAIERLFEPLRALRFSIANRLAFDTELALIPRWDWDSWGANFLVFFTRARRRVTYSERVNREKRARNWLQDSFFTHLSSDTDIRHESAYIRKLLNEQESLEVTPVAHSLHSGAVGTVGKAVPRPIVIGPFAAIARRTWPVDRWKTAIAELAKADGQQRIVIAGSQSDRELAEQIAASIVPAGEVQCGLSLEQVVRLLGEAKLFAGMDSGLAHLAGAAGIPVLQICCHPEGASPAHRNSPARFAALSPKTIVLQPRATPGCEMACEKNYPCCIANITAAAVAAAMQSLQGESREDRIAATVGRT